jgi:hypothetical protein
MNKEKSIKLDKRPSAPHDPERVFVAKSTVAEQRKKNWAFQHQKALPIRLPVASLDKAKTAFKKFTLSKFDKSALPHNHVGPIQRTAEFRLKTKEIQKQTIARNLTNLEAQETSNRAMTVSLPLATIKHLLPSYDQKAATIDLDELMSLVGKKMHGTEFYAKGNAFLERLSVQSQVQKIVSSIKGGGK